MACLAPLPSFWNSNLGEWLSRIMLLILGETVKDSFFLFGGAMVGFHSSAIEKSV